LPRKDNKNFYRLCYYKYTAGHENNLKVYRSHIKKGKKSWVLWVCACNLSLQETEASLGYIVTPYPNKKGWTCGSVVEQLPSTCKVLGFISSVAKK
jgi:hypothetical protein